VDGTDFTALKKSRALLFFIIKGGMKRCPSAQELANMKCGEGRFGVLACAAKSDPLVLHFLPSPIIVGFNPEDPEDAGLILRDLALHCQVPMSKMRSTPL
jgi:NAD(P)H-dependent flavin oxidoreductase YrpB (nitropropane dioxygenase family)